MKLFGLDKYNVIQLHVVLVLFGYWFVSAVANLLIGETSQSISIGYRLFQFIISLYVVFLCRKDIFRRQVHLLPIVCLLGLVFFSIRIIFDIIGGPFSDIVPESWFLKDFLYNVIGVFFSAFALLVSLRYIDIDKIVSIAFIIGLITIICILGNINNLQDSIESTRLDSGRGLGSLNIVQIGAIEVLLSIHLLLNKKRTIRNVFICIIGLILAIITTLASGSRGGLVALIFALGLYLFFRYRKNVLMVILIVIIVWVIALNIIPILNWLSYYFPVVSNRLMDTIIENDQSGRDWIRKLAIEKIIENPILGYSYRLFPTETGYYPHNGILEVLLISGVPIGFLFLYFLYIKNMLLVLKICKMNKFFFSVTLTLFVLIASMSGTIIYNSVFWVAVVLLCSYYYKKIV